MRGGPPRRQFGPLHLRKRRPPQPAAAPIPEKARTWPFALCEDPTEAAGFNVRGPDGYVVLDGPVSHARATAECERLNAAADGAHAFGRAPGAATEDQAPFADAPATPVRASS